MIIGIDGNEANIKNRVGVNMYAFELIWNIWKLQAEWRGKHSLIVYLKEPPMLDLPKETQNFKYKVIPGAGLWILRKLVPDLLKTRPRPDIFFSPSHYVPFFAPMPLVCSVMDLGYLEFSGQFRLKDFWQLKLWTAISIFVSKSIIAISNSTKKDIVRHYPLAKSKVYVTQLAYDSATSDSEISLKDVRRVKSKYSIVDDYILYIGTLKPSKNIEGLVAAFAVVSKDNPDVSLVIGGKKGWMYKTILDSVEKYGLGGRVIFTDYVDEGDKPALRKGAKVFVQPSFWEGFGIDTLSAMAMGVPVIAANIGSLPEIVGDAGILVDPHNTSEIAAAINKVLSLSKLDYNSMSEECRAQASKFSWERTARETIAVLENK